MLVSTYLHHCYLPLNKSLSKCNFAWIVYILLYIFWIFVSKMTYRQSHYICIIYIQFELACCWSVLYFSNCDTVEVWFLFIRAAIPLHMFFASIKYQSNWFNSLKNNRLSCYAYGEDWMMTQHFNLENQ